jgi:hypothetical protein
MALAEGQQLEQVGIGADQDGQHHALLWGGRPGKAPLTHEMH